MQRLLLLCTGEKVTVAVVGHTQIKRWQRRGAGAVGVDLIIICPSLVSTSRSLVKEAHLAESQARKCGKEHNHVGVDELTYRR